MQKMYKVEIKCYNMRNLNSVNKIFDRRICVLKFAVNSQKFSRIIVLYSENFLRIYSKFTAAKHLLTNFEQALTRSSFVSDFIEIHWTSGSLDEARKISRYLVQKRYVACAKIVPWIESVYIPNVIQKLDLGCAKVSAFDERK
jgi:hypothetical protein